jgi:predicted dehydrogenase
MQLSVPPCGSHRASSFSRRAFLAKGGTAAIALAGAPLLWGQDKQIVGANSRVRVAVIGIHGMGQSHIAAYSKIPNVEVAALCDVDQNLFGQVIPKLFKGKAAPKTVTDLRRLYEDKSIDAVSVVTPNHWHALAAIWAIQAGKHVSVEKPCCHNFYEGRKLVEAAEKYPNIIVQDGAEQRSNPVSQSMAKFLHEGGLGEVYMAKGICYKRRDTIGNAPEEPVPAGVDYDLWLGPAPQRPFSRNRFHYKWHWNWDYGNGDIGNQGVHELDIARWGLGVTLPTRVCAIGGHVMFNDDQQTPNVLMAMLEFPNPAGGGGKKKILQFEVRHWLVNRELEMNPAESSNTYMTSSANTVGNLFYGAKGYMAKNLQEWKTFMGSKLEPGPSNSGPEANHYQDFIDAIRAGDRSRAHGDIREGFYTCALAHLANISYRLGRSLDFDPVTMEFKNDAEANAMLTRSYRAPFVVPDKV